VPEIRGRLGAEVRLDEDGNQGGIHFGTPADDLHGHSLGEGREVGCHDAHFSPGGCVFPALKKPKHGKIFTIQ
jgi:hypothetical protein